MGFAALVMGVELTPNSQVSAGRRSRRLRWNAGFGRLTFDKENI